MSGSNRLLDMLKSAASPLGAPSVNSSSSSFSHPDTNVINSQTPQTPAAASPPPSLQAVSLQDLFASITSPPLPSTTSTRSSFPVEENNHQSNLLGMLKGPGNPFTANGGHHTAGAETPIAAMEKTLGGTDTPLNGTFGAVGSGYLTPPDIGHVASTKPHAEPVVTHPVGSTSNSYQSPSADLPKASSPAVGKPAAIVPSRDQSKSPARSGKPQNGLPPSVPSPQSSSFATAQPLQVAGSRPADSTPSARQQPHKVASPAPQKSPFEFVSPFDVFEKPKPKPKYPAEKKQESTATASPTPSTGHGLPRPATPPTANPAKSNTAQNIQQSTARSRQVSQSGSKDLGLPWLVGKVVEKGIEGQGPNPTGNRIEIDLSKPQIESLVNTPGSVQIIPTTIMKADTLDFSKGRSVGISSSWMAYALSRGRVRLIDKASGARLVLTAPNSTSPVLDLAVTPTSVAVVGSDNSVTVFEVPSGWDRDDPPCEVIAHISPAVPSSEDDIGPVDRVEWVKKNGEPDRLAIGGSKGVVIVRPDQLGDNVTTADLGRNNRVVQAEGTLAAFCLNHSHQAIALVSPTGFLTLYNVSNSQRVWNRQLPFPESTGGTAPSPVSSVLFCESNVLIGSEKNTKFDLFQITVEIACISSIRANAPAPSPSNLHYSKVVYDTTRSTLWIAPFSRGSLYGVRYALKGVAPTKTPERSLLVAFDKIMELPLEPVLSFVVGQKSASEDAEVFFATPNGFSQAIIDRSTCEDFSAAPIVEAQQEQKQVEEVKPKEESAKARPEQARRGSRQPKKSSPLVVKEELPSEDDEARASPQTGLTLEALEKLFKKSDEKNASNLKNTLTKQLNGVTSQLDAFSNGELANKIAKAVEQSVKATLSTVVQNEIKRTVIPALQATVQIEVRNVINSTVPLAVSSAVQNIPNQVEKSLAPVIQNSMASLVHGTVEKSLQESLHSVVLPALTNASNGLANQLSAEVKSELVQIRKDLPMGHDAPGQVEAITKTLADLQRQVSNLTEQLSRQQAPPLGLTAVPVPPASQETRSFESPIRQAQPAPHVPVAAPPVLPSPNQLNELFFQGLSASTTAATVGLVNEYWSVTQSILPNPPAASPLTQAMILTLLHRLALALQEMNPSDPLFNKIATWECRAATLINPRDPDISAFYTRVLPVIQAVLGNVLQYMSRAGGTDEAGRNVRSALDVLAQKV